MKRVMHKADVQQYGDTRNIEARGGDSSFEYEIQLHVRCSVLRCARYFDSHLTDTAVHPCYFVRFLQAQGRRPGFS